MWHRILRYLTLSFFAFGMIFFGFALFTDYLNFQGTTTVGRVIFAEEILPIESVSAEVDAYPTLTIESVLRSTQRRERSDDEIVLRVAGDVAPVRVADLQLRKKGMSYAFSQIGDVFRSDDVSLVNLETPIIADCPMRNEGMIFCALPEFVGAMRDAGVELAGLANNHSGNYGEEGMSETLRHLKEGELLSLDDGEILLNKVDTTVFGIVALNGVTSQGIDRTEASRLIRRTHEQADVVIVTVHWGAEYVLKPSSAAGVAPDDPLDLGKWFVDEGADLVVGHHPHVVQGIELYNGGFIAYSHGNFIFDQEWSRETKEGVIGNYVFSNKKLVDVYFTPVIIEDWVRPKFANETESRMILERMRRSSEMIISK